MRCAGGARRTDPPGRRMRSRRPSESWTPSALGLSNFRFLFLRARRCPKARCPKTCAEFGFVRRDVEGEGALGHARGIEPMQKRNAVQLRLAFSAAAICAVLAAATFSGAHRAGSLAIRTVRETEPILVRSISTIKKPVCSAARNLTSESATVAAEGHGEAALHSCANVAPPIHDRSKPASKPSSIGALAFLNSASPQPSSMLFRQT